MFSRLFIAVSCIGALAVASPTAAIQVAQRNLPLLAQRNDFPQPNGARAYSSCWTYVHSDGREYGVLGVKTGTAIYNVTDPAATYLVAFIPGPSSTWREMKSYRDWIYVTTEGVGPSPPPGIQIIRMTDPEHPVLAATWTGSFIRSHTIAIDTTRALIACNGARSAPGFGIGTFILSIANPEAPVELAHWPTGRHLAATDSQYVHDSVFRGNFLYASSLYAGKIRVFDLTDPSAMVEIAAWPYAGAFPHNSWLDASGNFLYVTDEVKGEPLKIFDVSNLAAPRLVNAITSNPNACVHNAFVRGDELYLANYSEGVRVLDISDPAHPAEFAWADSYLEPEGTFVGVWNVSPYLPSGTVVASDFVAGLLVYRPIRDYGILRVQVVDAATQQPLEGVTVTLTSQGDSLVTPGDGIVQFAPNPGTHTLFARRFGYVAAGITRGLAFGARDTSIVALQPIPTGMLEGTVSGLDSQAPLTDVQIDVAGAPIHIHDHGNGHYVMTGVPDGDYTLEVHRPGYAPYFLDRHIGPAASGTQNFVLAPAHTWDTFETESGWTVGSPDDRAASGIWTRVVPYPAGGSWDSPVASTAARAGSALEALYADVPPRRRLEHEGHASPAYPHQVQPGEDRTPGAGAMCFVTGQGTEESNVWENALSGGSTTLTSPPLDLGGLADPAIGYWRWFYSDGGSRDCFAVFVSGDDGATWVPVDTTRGFANHWREGTVRLGDYLAPGATARIRFVANGAGGTVEAAVDDITTFDLALAPLPVPKPTIVARLTFAAPRPNPSPGTVTLALDVPRAGMLEVDVIDLAGRRVRILHRGAAAGGTMSLRWDGTDEAGRVAPAGLYFARARHEGIEDRVRIVRVR